MEFGQYSILVGCNGTFRNIVNDTGFGENFILDSPVVTVRTADGALLLGCKTVTHIVPVVAKWASFSGKKADYLTDCNFQ